MRKKQRAAPKPGRRIFVGWVVGAGTPDKYCFPAYTVGAGIARLQTFPFTQRRLVPHSARHRGKSG